jgi:hypothetical protein
MGARKRSVFSAKLKLPNIKLDSFAFGYSSACFPWRNIISLGRSVESLEQSTPVIDSTTQIVVHERKRGHGHKKMTTKAKNLK